MMNEPKRKAIALLSGGLDSALSAKIVKDQGVEVTGLHLISPFGCKEDVQTTARSIGIPLILKEKGAAYLDIIEHPRYGYGRSQNPCIDCRIFMFQLADVVRQDEGADFIVTGEVVGQRPMSQHRNALALIENKSPLKGLVLRPLSAHLLPPTVAENEGWISREALFRISGRGRKEQLALAAELNLSHYSQPGGGCLLTETAFAPKLKDFFKYPTYQSDEERLAQSELLRIGRHFRLSMKTKVILGRNQAENQLLESLWPKTHGWLFHPKDFLGPTAIALGEVGEEEKQKVGQLIIRYCRKLEEPYGVTYERFSDGDRGVLSVQRPIAENLLEAWRI